MLDGITRLVVELAAPPDWPDGPLDGPVAAPELSVEFDNGNGGVDASDWEPDGVIEPTLGIVVNGVTVNGIDVLEGPTGIERDSVGRFEDPVEVMPVDPGAPLTVFVELGMGNGADDPEVWAVTLLETPEPAILDMLVIPPVEPPERMLEFVNGPVGIGVVLRETGPGPVGTRLPVDPNIVEVVELENGNGAEIEDVGNPGLPLEPTDCPVGLPKEDPVELRVEVDETLVGGKIVPEFDTPVELTAGEVELDIENGAV